MFSALRAGVVRFVGFCGLTFPREPDSPWHDCYSCCSCSCLRPRVSGLARCSFSGPMIEVMQFQVFSQYFHACCF